MDSDEDVVAGLVAELRVVDGLVATICFPSIAGTSLVSTGVLQCWPLMKLDMQEWSENDIRFHDNHPNGDCS